MTITQCICLAAAGLGGVFAANGAEPEGKALLKKMTESMRDLHCWETVRETENPETSVKTVCTTTYMKVGSEGLYMKAHIQEKRDGAVLNEYETISNGDGTWMLYPNKKLAIRNPSVAPLSAFAGSTPGGGSNDEFRLAGAVEKVQKTQMGDVSCYEVLVKVSDEVKKQVESRMPRNTRKVSAVEDDCPDKLGYVISEDGSFLMGVRAYTATGSRTSDSVVDQFKRLDTIAPEQFDLPKGYAVRTPSNGREFQEIMVKEVLMLNRARRS